MAVSQTVFERFTFEPEFSICFGILALVGIAVTARQLRQRQTRLAAHGLGWSIVATLAWFGHAWLTYTGLSAETRGAMVNSGCFLMPVLALISVVAAALVLLSIAERYGTKRRWQ